MDLDYLLLISCIFVALGLVLYLFYWNRFIAYVISLGLRLWGWNHGGASTWIEFRAIHISVLAGRILLKDLKYHSSDVTVVALKCQISWRYWIRRPMDEQDLGYTRAVGGETDASGKPSHKQPPCRVNVTLQGVRVYIHNRIAAFDNIVSEMESRASTENPPQSGGPGHSDAVVNHLHSKTSFARTGNPAVAPEAPHTYPPSSVALTSLRAPRFFDRIVLWISDQLPTLDPRELLPMSVEVSKAIVICGNASTPSLLIGDFRSASGTVGLVPARSKYDIHKQVYDLTFKDLALQFVENEDYQEPMPIVGERVSNAIKKTRYTKMRSMAQFSYAAFVKLWRKLKLSSVLPAPTPAVPTGYSGALHTATMRMRRAFKRRRLAEEEVDYTKMEYAIERKLLEAPLVELSYYIDTVGKVPLLPGQGTFQAANSLDVGNMDLDPEWGIDITIHGGILRYGPWADRQRAHLQRAFFPPIYSDSIPSTRLKAGDTRVWTALKLYVEFTDGATLLLPFREASKDWQWDRKTMPPRSKTRDAAYLHLRVSEGSSLRYHMPMVATAEGYNPVLEVHLDSISATSSLNDIRLLDAESCRIRCDMPSPLGWRSSRQWTFAISLRQPVLYLIRDHINMFTDLGKDWSSGPPSAFQTWFPITYAMSIELREYQLNLYANDLNIIDKPLVKDDNSQFLNLFVQGNLLNFPSLFATNPPHAALVSLRGPTIQAKLTMPLDVFGPMSTSIPFLVDMPGVVGALTLPRWNTHWVRDDPRQTELAKVGLVQLGGSYTYFADIRPGNQEQLELSFKIRDVAYKAFGWSIRTLMVLRDNYFGAFTHFSTLNEFLAKKRRGQSIGDPVELQYRPGTSNPIHVALSVDAENLLIILPAGLSGYDTMEIPHTRPGGTGIGPCVVATVPQLSVDLRTHEHFMEMSLTTDHIVGCVEPDVPDKALFSSPRYRSRKEVFVLDGLRVTANRLFGPQPHGSTYVCIWDIGLDALKASCAAADASVLGAVANAFTMNFADALNAPAADHGIPIDPDVSFLMVGLGRVDIVWDAGPATVHLALPSGLSIHNNDWAGTSYRKVTSIRLPLVTLAFLLSSSSTSSSWIEAARINLGVNLDIYNSPRGWEDAAQLQQNFVGAQDAPTGRFAALFDQTDGYCLLRHGLYLPRLQSPKTFRRRRASALQHLLVPHAHPAAQQVSESEHEDPIPDAIRDARVAQARPAHHARQLDEQSHDEDMTSGDESDDADLTDHVESDDENFPSRVGDSEWLDVAKVRRCTSSFSASFIRKPSLWEQSPFKLTRTQPNFSNVHHPTRKFRVASQSPDHPSILRNNSISPQSVFHASASHVTIFVTPLLLPITDWIIKDLRASSVSPSIWVDGLMADYIGSFGSKHANPTTLLDVSVASIRIQSLQSASPVHQAQDHGFGTRPLNPETSHGRYHTTNVTALDLTSATFRLSLLLHGDGSSTAAVSAAEAKLSLGTLLQGLRQRTTVMVDTRMEVSLGGSSISTQGTSVHASLQSIHMQADQNAPAQSLATAIAVATFAQAMARLGDGFASRSNKALHASIQELLQMSHDKHIIDPLSTIQPSYLVQLGLPRRLRTDETYKILAYIRSSLSQLTEDERARLSSLDVDSVDLTDPELTSRLLSDQLHVFAPDVDTPNARSQPIWQRLLPLLEPPHTKGASSSMPSITTTVNLGHLSLKVFDPHGTHDSSFTLGPAQIVVNTCMMTFTPASIGDAGKPTIVVNPIMPHTASIRQVKFAVLLGQSKLVVHPNLMDFVGRTVRAQREYGSLVQSSFASERRTSNKPPGSPISISAVPSTFLEGNVAITHFQVEAAAENIVCVVGVSGLSVPITLTHKPRVGKQEGSDISTNASVILEELFLRGRSVAEFGKRKDDNILASLSIRQARANLLLRQDPPLPLNARVMSNVEQIYLHVPRSAVRLYRFAQEWRAEFLPRLEAAVDEFLSNIRTTNPPPSAPPPVPRNQLPTLQAQFQISSVLVALQVMHGTWLSWEARALLGHGKTATSGHNRRGQSNHFGLQVGSQLVGVASKPGFDDVSTSGTRVKVEIPALSILARYSPQELYTLILIEKFQATIKPSHLDVVLSVQQKFGRDFDDLMALVKEGWRSKEHEPNPSKTDRLPPAPSKAQPLKYRVFLKSMGFRIGLQAPASSLYLECDKLDGGMNNEAGRIWNIKLSDFALSMAQRTGFRTPQNNFNRKQRSAFVIIDVHITEGEPEDISNAQKVLRIDFTKVHAVMQPSSIGEIGDFVDHIQADMLARKEKRAAELADFREKTRTFMRSFEISPSEGVVEDRPFLHDYLANLTIKNIGVAFPLTLDPNLELPRSGSQDSAASRAFLVSIKTLAFSVQHGESGHAVMKGFSFQFVPQFRLSVPTDYAGDSHMTRNRLLYPEMTANVRAERHQDARRVLVSADVSGFVLDMDSTLPDFVFSLMDVYKQGKEQVGRLSASGSLPRPSTATSSILRDITPQQEQGNASLSSNVFASLVFRSGKVRLYSSATASMPRNRTASFSHHEGQFSDLHAEVLNLPEVSVWGEYRASPSLAKLQPGERAAPAVLIFKSTVHSSQNTLLPTTLLPFMAEFNSVIERRMRTSSSWQAAEVDVFDDTPTDNTDPTFASNMNMQISLSLRIDQSKLELTCQPDVNVVAGVNWESGGFVVNLEPGARKVAFTGVVGGLTISLRHGFLSEDCATLQARNLAFTTVFTKGGQPGHPETIVSLVVDTMFSGAVRLSRLQDLLCFKAVWLDRIPVFAGQTPVVPPTPLSPSISKKTGSTTETKGAPFMTTVLVRLRQINLDVDLGQSISTIALDLRDALVRTKITNWLSEVSLQVGNVNMLASGNVSGKASVPDFVFKTFRTTEAAISKGEPITTMLDLNMTSGPLDIILQSEHQDILRYCAEPVTVRVFDDWSQAAALHTMGNQQLRLSFEIDGTDFAAAVTVGTVPKLVAYAEKFKANLEQQREGASRESKAFRIARAPKPDNPLSSVANAMLQSARTKFKEADSGLSYLIQQRMSLHLRTLRLAVFPRRMDDYEMAHFLAKSVTAQLDRIIESDQLPSKRDLKLGFASMAVSKLTQLNHVLVHKSNPKDSGEWLAMLAKGTQEANIFGLPSMTMNMGSEESLAPSRKLTYDFKSAFVRSADNKKMEDIYITLNVSLYSWLTLLRKNFQREMDEVETSNANAGMLSSPITRKRNEGGHTRSSSTASAFGEPQSRASTLEPVGHARSASASFPARTRTFPSGIVTPSMLSPSSSMLGLVEDPQGNRSPLSPGSAISPLHVNTPTVSRLGMADGLPSRDSGVPSSPTVPSPGGSDSATPHVAGLVYDPRKRDIERLTMRQLGDATPDVMHPFFMKKAGFSLEDSLPQYVHEFATTPLEEIMKALLELYSKQLKANKGLDIV